MSGPEEDLAQGGRFPQWFERFIKLLEKVTRFTGFAGGKDIHLTSIQSL